MIFEDAAAQAAHEANRVYCSTIGDNSQPHWEDAPDWQKDSARNGVRAHFATLAAGREPTPEASHVGWLAQKEAEGWVYGETKDVEAKTHPCMVPYNDLPSVQQKKDAIFVAVVKAFFWARNS